MNTDYDLFELRMFLGELPENMTIKELYLCTSKYIDKTKDDKKLTMNYFLDWFIFEVADTTNKKDSHKKIKELLLDKNIIK